MKIKITSDSTCDLSPALLEQYNITLTPLTIIKEGENYQDGKNITPTDIFAHVASGGNLCSTAAVNIDEYITLFSDLSPKYDAVIHINLGSNFSSCHQNATLAAEEFSNVYAIDSMNLSSGQGLLVLEACRLASDATDAAALCDELCKIATRIDSSFLLNRLDYLAKGGRCSSVMALGANILKLKPCIEVVGGKMQVGKKYRGSYAKCLEAYIKDRLDGPVCIEQNHLLLPTAAVSPEDFEVAQNAIAQYGQFQQVIETTAGCTISCHCGPCTLGLMALRKDG